MAGGVQEGDGLAAHVHLIGADVLGDAAGLAGDHVGVADIVQQGGLAVVHVAHDHHHGGAGDQILLLVLGGVNELLLDGDHHFLLHLAAQLHSHQGGGVVVDDLAEGGHDAHLHQGLDHLGASLLMREASSPTPISSGIITFTGAFLAISSWRRRIFSASSWRRLLPGPC